VGDEGGGYKRESHTPVAGVKAFRTQVYLKGALLCYFVHQVCPLCVGSNPQPSECNPDALTFVLTESVT